MRALAEPAGPSESRDRYTVDVRSDDGGWRVAIIDGDTDLSVRACRSEQEARTYASTVRQHLAWLSPSKFGEYYRLNQEA